MSYPLIGLRIAVCFILSIVFPYHSFSQEYNPDNQLKYVDIIPPSPSVSSLISASRPDVGMVSGSAQFNIPITTVSQGGLTVPISLSYSSNGVKVDEMASRVGIGWNLIAGGVITRTVQGSGPDEDTKFMPAPAMNTWELRDYLERVTSSTGDPGTIDSQLDIFSYSFLGISGEFILDDGNTANTPFDSLKNLNQVIQLAKHNLKIERIINAGSLTFKITDAMGNVYRFNAVEETKKNNSCGKWFDTEYVPTAWFLTKIELFNGEEITFGHTQVSYQYDLGVNQTMNYTSPSQNAITIPCSCPSYEAVINTCVNYMQVNTFYLTQIYSRGKRVIFQYRDRDDSNDLLLRAIHVKYGNEDAVEEYLLNHNQIFTNVLPPANLVLTTSIDVRPFLQSVYRNSELLYSFGYNQPETLPTRLSFAQDHWGYFNGQANASLMSTPALADIRAIFPSATANREPNELYSSRGMLNKITYPTGGYDAIVYEPNSHWETRSVPPTTPTTKYDSVKIVTHSHAGVEEFEGTLALYFEQDVTVHIWNNKTNGNAPTPDDYGTLRLTKSGMTDIVIDVNSNESTTQTLTLPAGTYSVYTRAVGDNNRTKTQIRYIPNSPTDVTKNWPIAGVRMKSVVSYSDNHLIQQTRSYQYGLPTSPAQSVAVIRYAPQYYKQVLYDYQTTAVFTQGGTPACVTRFCGFQSYFSSSLTNLFTSSGGPVSYPSVIESMENLDGVNTGFIAHTFDVTNDDYGTVLMGNSVLGAPQTNFSIARNGKEIQTIHFKRNGNLYDTVQRVQKFYASYSELLNYHSGFVVNRLFASCVGESRNEDPTQLSFAPFELTRYGIFGPWVELDSTVEDSYDPVVNGRMLRMTTKYEYNDVKSMQVTRLTRHDSKGQQEEILNYYPLMAADLPGIDSEQQELLETLNARGRNELVHQKRYVNGQYVGGYNVEYSDEFTSIQPKKISIYLQEGIEADAFVVTRRDVSDNVLERVNSSGIYQCFIWDHERTVPTAKVDGARFNEIAFSGFEGQQLGNWMTSGVTSFAYDSTSPTGGIRCLTLGVGGSLGSATKNDLEPGKRYALSFWTKTEAGKSFTLPGTILEHETKTASNGWIHHYYIISGVHSIAVQSVNAVKIDDLRLYPEGAQMITLNYKHLVGPDVVTDGNDRSTFYEYDHLGRLVLVRDDKSNVLKTYQYKLKIHN